MEKEENRYLNNRPARKAYGWHYAGGCPWCEKAEMSRARIGFCPICHKRLLEITWR